MRARPRASLVEMLPLKIGEHFCTQSTIMGHDRRSRRASVIAFLSRSAVRSGRFFTTRGGPWRRNTATSNRLVAGFQRLWDAGRVPSIASNGTNSSPYARPSWVSRMRVP